MSAVYAYHAVESGGVLLRDGVAVADIVNGQCKMRPEHKKHAIQAGKFWKSYNSSAQLPSDVIAEASEPDSPAVAVAPDAPPMPPIDPTLGTKTPAVVEWYKRHAPEAWANMHGKWANR